MDIITESAKIIFFGKFPVYIGNCEELSLKVYNFYITYIKGDLTQATSLFFEFDNLLKEKLLKVLDSNGLNLLQNLLIEQKKDDAQKIINTLTRPSLKYGYKIVSKYIDQFYSSLKKNEFDEACIIFNRFALAIQKKLLKIQDAKNLTFYIS